MYQHCSLATATKTSRVSWPCDLVSDHNATSEEVGMIVWDGDGNVEVGLCFEREV